MNLVRIFYEKVNDTVLLFCFLAELLQLWILPCCSWTSHGSNISRTEWICFSVSLRAQCMRKSAMVPQGRRSRRSNLPVLSGHALLHFKAPLIFLSRSHDFTKARVKICENTSCSCFNIWFHAIKPCRISFFKFCAYVACLQKKNGVAAEFVCGTH